MTLIAKPIVKDHLWVVTDGINKVGNIESEGGQYKLKLGDQVKTFESTKKITKISGITFYRNVNIATSTTLPYAVWPTDVKRTHNDMLDISRKLHIFTKEDDSKCYYAAGWFAIRINDGDKWETQLCPKYIFLQRYSYMGPYKTQREADDAIKQSV